MQQNGVPSVAGIAALLCSGRTEWGCVRLGAWLLPALAAARAGRPALTTGQHLLRRAAGSSSITNRE
jgi:hypothetical protein